MIEEQSPQNKNLHLSNVICSPTSAVRERPILFSTPMVKAILEGRKTQTRRIIKEAKGWDANWKVSQIKEEHKDGIPRYEMRCGTQYHLPWFKSRFHVGDILWVRETFCPNYDDSGNAFFKADWNNVSAEFVSKPKWKPSIFMPYNIARIHLEVESVTAQRLHDISEEDAIAEGASHNDKYMTAEERYYNYNNPSAGIKGYSHKAGFEDLWIKINGKESWDENPFVWAVGFNVALSPKGYR